MKKHKLNIVLSMILAGLSAVVLSGCSEWDKKSPDENTTVEVVQDSNAILEPIRVVGRGYDYIELRSSGVDEDGIDHVAFYAIANGAVKATTSKRLEGEVSFDIQVRLTGLKDDTVYELRTVCYSVNGKTKSIEKHSVKTFAKTPNDPSNDTQADTQKPLITLNGASTLTLTVGDTYTEQGATVTDNVDTGLTATIGGDTVDTSTAGTYVVTYTATDSAGNVADVVRRTVNVVNVPNTAPRAIDGSVDWGSASSKTFSMADVISDAEDADSALTIIVTTPPAQGTLNISWTSATYNMSSWNAWSDFFFFQVEDSEWLKSDIKRYDLSNFDNV